MIGKKVFLYNIHLNDYITNLHKNVWVNVLFNSIWLGIFFFLFFLLATWHIVVCLASFSIHKKYYKFVKQNLLILHKRSLYPFNFFSVKLNLHKLSNQTAYRSLLIWTQLFIQFFSKKKLLFGQFFSVNFLHVFSR